MPKWNPDVRPEPDIDEVEMVDLAVESVTQEYGQPVRHRLQERLDDPYWLQRQAARCNDRAANQKLVERLGIMPKDGNTFNPNVPIAGLPVPPPRYFGSAHMMAAHYRTYSADHKIAMNFNAANNTVVVTGRPVQAIVLSHEKAQYLERDPYLAWLLRPLSMQVLLGYSAVAHDAPKGPKHFCVIRWFQEAVFVAG